MAEELVPINIVIADRTYRIKLSPHEEEVVRKTVKLINDKIIEFKTQFAGKDMQDYIAMVVIWYATQTKLESDSDVIATEHLEALAKIGRQLDKAVE